MIRLGRLVGYTFDGPHRLLDWSPPSQPGVYAILVKSEGVDRYRVIDVGDADNLAAAGLSLGHPRAPCWAEAAHPDDELHVACFGPPGLATRSIRTGIATELNVAYRPPCSWEEYGGPFDEGLSGGDDPWPGPPDPPPPGGVREPRRADPSGPPPLAAEAPL